MTMNVINTSSENLSKLILICRLCGKASDSYINIFGQDGMKNCVNNKILKYLKVKILNTDLLPKIICDKCIHKLDEFHNFFLISKKVQSLLKNTINECLFKTKIKIGLPGNELVNNNTNPIKKNCETYSIDEKQDTNIKQPSIYNRRLLCLSDKSSHNNDNKINSKLLLINESTFGNKYIEYNQIRKCQDENDFFDRNKQNIEKNTSKFTEIKYEDTLNSNFNDISQDYKVVLNGNSSELTHSQYNSMKLFENSTDENNKISDTLARSKSCIDNYNENSILEFDNDISIHWPCTTCNTVFKHVKELIKHCKEQHNSSTPSFKCTLCGKIYKVLKNFYKHYKKHNTINKHTCNECGKSFTRNWTLQIHATVHSDTKPFKCNECSKTFKNLCSLKNHKKSHLPDECKLGYFCSFCEKSFKTKFILKSHQRIHTGQKDFNCDICNKSFVTKGSLFCHIALHNNSKEIECTICKKMLRTEKLLRRHLLFHASKKLSKCEYCGKEYRYLTQLKEHVRIHTGELPYACEYCQKRFRLNSTLIIHRRQHTGIKPYKCKVCDHSFTNWPNYNKHMNRKHYNTIVKEKNDELILLKM